MGITERRLDSRVNLRIPLRFRPINNVNAPMQVAESVNLSPRGAYFATDFPLQVGAPVEIFMKMPRELTGQPSADVRCTALVVHIERDAFVGGKAGVGVHIERYEALAGAERWTS